MSLQFEKDFMQSTSLTACALMRSACFIFLEINQLSSSLVEGWHCCSLNDLALFSLIADMVLDTGEFLMLAENFEPPFSPSDFLLSSAHPPVCLHVLMLLLCHLFLIIGILGIFRAPILDLMDRVVHSFGWRHAIQDFFGMIPRAQKTLQKFSQ